MAEANSNALAQLQEHRSDLMNALVALELIEEESTASGSSYLANLIGLGKMAINSKLEVLDGRISTMEKEVHYG